jgi:hypothetical protein
LPLVATLDYGSGITEIDRFANVQFAEPPPETLYCAVKVVLVVAVSAMTNCALACCWAAPARIRARVSEAASVVPPLTVNDMKPFVEAELQVVPAVTVTSALVVPAGNVMVTIGPAVVSAA